MSVIPFRSSETFSSWTQDDTNRGTFARVPTGAISDLRVGDRELRVIAAIAKYADKDGWAYPSEKKLGDDLGVTRTAIHRQINKAVAHGYIKRSRRTKPTGGYSSNLYRVIFNNTQNAQQSASGEFLEPMLDQPSEQQAETLPEDYVPF